MTISASFLSLSRLHLTDFRWGAGLAGRSDNKANPADSLRVFRVIRMYEGPVPAAVGVATSLVAPIPVNIATPTVALVASAVGVVPANTATPTIALVASVSGVVPVNATTPVVAVAASAVGVVPVNTATPIDALTGDLCSGSVFGRALLGDALFG
ncbi:MAG: hypothetical protein HQL99_14145 [Magnetococcales bacterium]|nr:hypothetical protein [Magnetococcales bacterium]